MRPKISLLHATYHREGGPLAVKEAWIGRADRPEQVEYVFAMDSDDENLYDDVDSGNESSGDDVDFPMEDEQGNSHKERPSEVEDYPYEVLSTEEIVQHMVDCIKEVNTVVEVSIISKNF